MNHEKHYKMGYVNLLKGGLSRFLTSLSLIRITAAAPGKAEVHSSGHMGIHRRAGAVHKRAWAGGKSVMMVTLEAVRQADGH